MAAGAGTVVTGAGPGRPTDGALEKRLVVIPSETSDLQEQVPNCRQQMTWAPDRGGNPVGIEGLKLGSDLSSS